VPEITIISPTYNERENVAHLYKRIDDALPSLDWELVFVDDDSPDGTADQVRELASDDSRVRVIQRLHRRGLSGAVIEGALSSSAPYIAVIDADLQHDETLLSAMLEKLRSSPETDLVVASRYTKDGSTGDWDGTRERISRLAISLGQSVTRVDLSDPMSGFFMIRRPVFMTVAHNLANEGFKILLDILATSERKLNVEEIPYEFRTRQFGESKLDSLVALHYVRLLLDKTLGRILPVRFIMFAGVNFLGLFLHLLVLWMAFEVSGLSFTTSQVIATLIAMTSNYLLNNQFTYYDRRLRGTKLVLGLLTFYVICSVGVVANVGMANYLYDFDGIWWIAGLAGSLVGLVWNYAVTANVTWRN